MTREQLIAFSLGMLESAEADTVESHILECSTCTQTMLELAHRSDTFVDELRSLSPETDFHESNGESQEHRGHLGDPNGSTEDVPEQLRNHPKFQVLDLIGHGGMGRVYLAKHRLMDRRVALKVIHPRLLERPGIEARFLREFKAIASLHHPNIVIAYDADEADGCHFLVMEYIEGESLSERVTRLGPQSIEFACNVVLQAARGLAFAHAAGLVHRDVKPQNLIIDQEGTVKLLDFGVALLSADDTSVSDQAKKITGLTHQGTVLGTPEYVAPEQWMTPSKIDSRVDIYGLGATFYFLLTGEAPNSLVPTKKKVVTTGQEAIQPRVGRHAATSNQPASAKQLAAKIELCCPGISTELTRLIVRMLAQDPEDRVADAATVVAQLKVMASEQDAFPPEPKPNDSRLGRRRWLMGITAAMGGAAVCTSFGAAFVVSQRPGTLVVVAPDPNLELEVSNADRSIVRSIRGDAELELPRGDYRIEVKSEPERYDVEQSMVSCGWGAREIVRVCEKTSWSPSIANFDAFIRSMNLQSVPAGTFWMGTPRHEKGDPTNRPREVRLTCDISMSQCEITQDQYRQVMGANPSHFSWSSMRSSKSQSAWEKTLPVENVTWDDATEFCERLSRAAEAQKLQLRFRLPSEAEWEYACRAGTLSAFSFGSSSNGKNANIDGKHPWFSAEQGPSLGRTSSIGSYAANAFGLHDMHGNVWEWCQDFYDVDYGQVAPPEDPRGPRSGTSRVIRGGAWDWGARFARSSARMHRPPTYRSSSLGFRVVCTNVS